MQKTQRTFTKEFKLEAVQLVKSSNKPLAQIARDLGIADSTLHHWRKLFDSAGRASLSRQWASDGSRRGDQAFLRERWRPCVRSVIC